MQVYNRANNMQSQTNTGLINASGAISLIESVKYFGDFILRNSLSRVLDVDIGSLWINGIADLNIAAFVYKLDCVLKRL